MTTAGSGLLLAGYTYHLLSTCHEHGTGYETARCQDWGRGLLRQPTEQKASRSFTTQQMPLTNMDSATETLFLLEVEKHKRILSSKDNSKKSRDKKRTAWIEVKAALLVKSGKEFEESQLTKKWSNLQERLKNKLKQRNMTGGGTSAELNTGDEITHRILGETNPIVNMVPGAWPPPPGSPSRSPARQSSSTSCDSSSDISTDITPRPPSSRSVLVLSTTTVMSAVDCKTRKRRKLNLPALAPPLPLATTLASQSSRSTAQEAYYKAGEKYFNEATKYYKRLNQNYSAAEEQFVFNSAYEEIIRENHCRSSC